MCYLFYFLGDFKFLPLSSSCCCRSLRAYRWHTLLFFLLVLSRYCFQFSHLSPKLFIYSSGRLAEVHEAPSSSSSSSAAPPSPRLSGIKNCIASEEFRICWRKMSCLITFHIFLTCFFILCLLKIPHQPKIASLSTTYRAINTKRDTHRARCRRLMRNAKNLLDFFEKKKKWEELSSVWMRNSWNILLCLRAPPFNRARRRGACVSCVWKWCSRENIFFDGKNSIL